MIRVELLVSTTAPYPVHEMLVMLQSLDLGPNSVLHEIHISEDA